MSTVGLVLCLCEALGALLLRQSCTYGSSERAHATAQLCRSRGDLRWADSRYCDSTFQQQLQVGEDRRRLLERAYLPPSHSVQRSTLDVSSVARVIITTNSQPHSNNECSFKLKKNIPSLVNHDVRRETGTRALFQAMQLHHVQSSTPSTGTHLAMTRRSSRSLLLHHRGIPLNHKQQYFSTTLAILHMYTYYKRTHRSLSLSLPSSSVVSSFCAKPSGIIPSVSFFPVRPENAHKLLRTLSAVVAVGVKPTRFGRGHRGR